MHNPITNNKISSLSTRSDSTSSVSRVPRYTGTNSKKRVVAYIDGFNLYHAINDLARPHFKWLDLKKLILCFIHQQHQSLDGIYYCSAYARFLKQACSRHEKYVRCIETTGVNAVMGQFKVKYRDCNKCGHTKKYHEEKESDVNLALLMLQHAHDNKYDEAIIITGDSDLAPAVRMIKDNFPTKKIRLVSPPGRLSYELSKVVDKDSQIKPIHLERSLFPEIVKDLATGYTVAKRPREYAPPK